MVTRRTQLLVSDVNLNAARYWDDILQKTFYGYDGGTVQPDDARLHVAGVSHRSKMC